MTDALCSVKELNQLRCHLLVVDDEEEITKSLFRQFRKSCDVFTANNTEQALQILKSQEIHVILCDQRMPNVTGTQFLTGIKKNYPDIIFLLLTGYADIKAVIEGINESHIDRYLTKPWDIGEVNHAVQQAFEKYRLHLTNALLLKELAQTNQELETRVLKRTEELAQANLELKKLNEQKDRFLSIVSHDLRNPLHVIQGYCSLLEEDAPLLPPKHKEFLHRIMVSIQQMISLVNDLLDIGRLNLGVLVLQKRPVSLKPYLHEVLETYHFLAAEKQIRLGFAYQAEILEMEIDPQRMKQALSNVLGNAVKFSPPGSEIILLVSQRPNWLCIEVKDQGAGIPTAEISRIFEAFKQGSQPENIKQSGVGLGLTICKSIVEAHGGKVSCQSQPGHGAQFLIELPIPY